MFCFKLSLNILENKMIEICILMFVASLLNFIIRYKRILGKKNICMEKSGNKSYHVDENKLMFNYTLTSLL